MNAWVIILSEGSQKMPEKKLMRGFFCSIFTDATAWYNDPDYQALSEHRRAGTHLEFLTMVHGLPPRS